MTRTTDTTHEKAPGAINTEGLATDTTNDPNFATGTRHSKAIATQVGAHQIPRLNLQEIYIH